MGTATGDSPSHLFANNGSYTVTVTVTNPLPAGDTNLTAGMGRTSIGVRAEELGGYAEIGPTGAGRGNLWRVHAVLPAAA